jgi:acetate kinase
VAVVTAVLVLVVNAGSSSLKLRVLSGDESLAGSRAMAGLGFLGVREDSTRNGNGTGDREIGMPGSRVRSLVIAAREDLEIARQVWQVLGT